MRHSILAGIVIGAATGFWMWCEYWLGLHTTHYELGKFTGAFALVIPIVGTIVALRGARRREGRLRFRDALKHGTVLSLAAAVAMGVMAAIYGAVLHPDWSTVAGGSTTAALVAQSAIGALVGGVLIAAIAGAVMRDRTARPATTAP